MFRRLLTGAALVALTASARAADVDPLLPAETENVLHVNVRQLLDSDVAKRYALGPAKDALDKQEVAQLLKDLALDPLKDIDRLTVASWGSGREDAQAFVIVRGGFDPGRLLKAAQDRAKTNGDVIAIVEEGRYKMVRLTWGDDQKPFYATVADDKTLIGGNDSKVVANAASVAEGGGKKPAVKREMAELLLAQDEKASMFSCGLVDGKLNDLPGLGNIPGANAERLAAGLAGAKTYGVTVDVGQDVAVEVVLGMKDAPTAEDFEEEVHNVFGALRNLLPLLAANKPNLKPLSEEIAKTLRSKVRGKGVIATLRVSAGAIGEAIGSDD